MHTQLPSNALLMRRRFLQGAAGSAALAIVSPSALAAKDDALAQPQVVLIDLAMKQRMLVQRCTKLYVQSILNARVSDAKRLIADSISRIDAAYAKQYAAEAAKEDNGTMMRTLGTIGRDWPKLRALIQKAPSEKALADLVTQSEALSKQINQSMGAMDMFLSRSPIGAMVATAGKQCFISQRIATYYFLRALKYNPEEATRLINDLVKDYEYNAKLLEKSPDNTAEIKFLLQLGGTQWPYFKEAINVQSRDEATQLDYNVATAAENMLEVLERTNLLYYKLATS